MIPVSVRSVYIPIALVIQAIECAPVEDVSLCGEFVFVWIRCDRSNQAGFCCKGVVVSIVVAFEFSPVHFYDNPHFFTMMIVAALFSFITLTKFGLRWQEKVYFTDYNKRQHIIAFTISIFGFIFCLGAINAFGFSPFIYFRF